MKRYLYTVLAAVALTASTFANDEGFISLFNGKTLEGWTAARSSGPGDWGAFSVNEEEQAIHTYAGREAGSKQENDCLNTEKEYSRYILKLEYKWVGNRYAPRTDWDRDAGLLFHVHGDLKKVWPLSIEMQIGETPGDATQKHRFHAGDLFVLGKNLRATTTKTGKFYDPEGNPEEGRGVRTRLGTEKPLGEWNEMEIRVYGAEKAVFILNGEKVLVLTDIKQKTDDGSYIPLEKGHIGLQAEWAELLYRNIRIKELPAE
ncbi:3-keto-disaccharide hydrolase [Pontiella agarivorans]|uniref:DUF1080 domain-containing protein n=1 Tax=Pontiella agarivorans TaxID=3038953 RepID=A0ABU5MZF4_9BACT|nr:DUF1080 domain-containing protein [Pontiella agarivorans]MDZ8119592.1 DUF1080 domain-containing protein [Pontiella agarivorans]